MDMNLEFNVACYTEKVYKVVYKSLYGVPGNAAKHSERNI